MRINLFFVLILFLCSAACSIDGITELEGQGRFEIDDQSWDFEVEVCEISNTGESYVRGRAVGNPDSKFIEIRVRRIFPNDGSALEQFLFRTGRYSDNVWGQADIDFEYGLVNEGVDGRAELRFYESIGIIIAAGKFDVSTRNGENITSVATSVGSLVVDCEPSDDDDREYCIDMYTRCAIGGWQGECYQCLLECINDEGEWPDYKCPPG